MKSFLHTVSSCLIPVILTSCNGDLLQSPQEQLAMIENLIHEKKYDDAMAFLEQSADHAKSREDWLTIAYNRAIVDVMRGNCDHAKQSIDAVFKEENILQLTSAYPSATEFLKSFTNRYPTYNEQLAHLHSAYAAAILCPNNPAPGILPLESFILAAKHIYQAILNGYDARNFLSLLLSTNIRDCHAFIPPEQGNHSTPQTAIDLHKKHGSAFSFTLCPPEGIWMTFHARKYEQLALNLSLAPINRMFFIDDSVRLPYIGLQVDVYAGDNNGTLNATPIHTYQQNLPDYPPTLEEFKKLDLQLPPFEIFQTGQYYIHFYTKDHGEAVITPSFKRSTNCQQIDDNKTYTQDLMPIAIDIDDKSEIHSLTLCPNRPDTFRFQLNARQSGLIAINSKNPQLSDGKIIDVAISNKNHQKLLKIDSHSATLKTPDSNTPTYKIFTKKLLNSDGSDITLNSYFILLENSDSDTQSYELNIATTDAVDSLDYQLAMSKSHPCPPQTSQQSHVELSINANATNPSEPIILPPTWICPENTVRIKPILPPAIQQANTQISLHMLSHNPIPIQNLTLETLIPLPPDNREYRSELATTSISDDWNAPFPIISYTLQKLILQQSHIQLSVAKQTQGFMLMSALPVANQSSNDDDSSKEDKKDKKNSDNSQKDKSQQQNAPDNSPQQRSQSPATPHGPGSDTQGHESTPQEQNLPNPQAHSYAPEQTSRDHIDALLDAIEEGEYVVPIPGKHNETTQNKNW